MIVLASASPRRRTLLSEAGLEFVVDPANVDETVADGLAPEEIARHLAERKACAVATRHSEADWIIGSDTVVAVGDPQGGWLVFGKPDSPGDARRMLERLSDSRHQVTTGVAIVRGGDGGDLTSESETTWVTMRTIEPREIDAYVASGEWRDKAGGYAIQETADAFVESLEGGGFDNVVGLPVALTLRLLGAGGAGPLPDSASA